MAFSVIGFFSLGHGGIWFHGGGKYVSDPETASLLSMLVVSVHHDVAMHSDRVRKMERRNTGSLDTVGQTGNGDT